ncbi:hypothetical protein J6E39_07155 [bacterium]|nr:hypothetical protein [bacterium]
MKLLFYTEKLAKKIMFYDNIAKQSLDMMRSNPFFKPRNITLVWVENDRK